MGWVTVAREFTVVTGLILPRLAVTHACLPAPARGHPDLIAPHEAPVDDNHDTPSPTEGIKFDSIGRFEINLFLTLRLRHEAPAV